MSGTRVTPRRRIRDVVVPGLACLAAACRPSQSGSRPTDTSTSALSEPEVPSPPGDLYSPPEPLDPAPPGTLIWAEKVGGLQLVDFARHQGYSVDELVTMIEHVT